MALWSNNDSFNSKPLFDKLMLQSGTVIAYTSNSALSTNTVLYVQGNGAGLIANMVINVANSNNVIKGANSFYWANTVVGHPGFNTLFAPSVVSVTGNAVTMSTALAQTIPAGQRLMFSKPVLNHGLANSTTGSVSANAFSANVVLVTPTRINKNNHSANIQVAHTGWVHVKPQIGKRAGRYITEVLVAMGSARAFDANSANQFGYYNGL